MSIRVTRPSLEATILRFGLYNTHVGLSWLSSLCSTPAERDQLSFEKVIQSRGKAERNYLDASERLCTKVVISLLGEDPVLRQSLETLAEKINGVSFPATETHQTHQARVTPRGDDDNVQIENSHRIFGGCSSPREPPAETLGLSSEED